MSISLPSFDLENPEGANQEFLDGILEPLRDKTNELKSENPPSNGEVAGTSNTTSQTNTPVKNEEIYYTDEFESVSYKTPEGADVSMGKKPTSTFNKFALIDFRGNPLIAEGGKGENSKFYNKIDLNTLQNPTATNIITTTSKCGGKGYNYSYSDFALAKYFGKIPNNMMITLRRFAYPAPDDIISPKATNGKGETNIDVSQPDLARAITFLGEGPGNNLADIIKFSHGFNWKNAEAKVQELQSQRGARSGILGNKINSNRFLRAAANSANGKSGYDDAVSKANAGFDAFSNTYPNHVYGPLNVIKEVVVREQGLTFSQEFTLKFQYNLKSLEGANPKILMLDQLANILALTYNNAPFWGGDVRYIGDGSVAKPLGDIKKIQSGDFGGFLAGVMKDLGGTAKNLFNDAKKITSGDSKFLNNIVGGGLMELLNSPQGGQAVQSLLTGDPTGQWHVTVGNPLNPIMVLGNLVCTNTEINFEGPMGIQDFPEKLVVSITLKPGRPRDKAEIESMFNAGRGRFYIQPADAPSLDQVTDISAYGNADRTSDKYTNEFKKIGLG